MIGEVIVLPEYTLYLDESEIPISDNAGNLIDKYIIIGGAIIENSYHNGIFSMSLCSIKDRLWHQNKFQNDRHGFILHELEVTKAHYGHISSLKHKYLKIFAAPSKYKKLYEELTNLVSNSDITVICACIKQRELRSLYKEEVLNDEKSILMQVIIENFYHFLVEKNSTGTICYESMHTNQNAVIEKRYNYIKNTGTMFFPAKQINKRIMGLNFVEKSRNIAGLQIADFIPNTLGRVECKKDSNSDAYYNSVYNKLYDGNRGKIDKFGFKIIP